MLSIHLTGINYKKAPLDIRERLSFNEDDCKRFLSHISQENGIEEAVILSTCNRTELYVVADHSAALSNGKLTHALTRFVGLQDSHTDEYFYRARDFDAVEHLFKVAAGLDSMVLGEDQILGQVRDAYSMAVEAKTAGRFFHKIFHQSFRVGKRSRSETKISWGASSIGSVAVELALKIFSDFSEKYVLMVGAGEIAQVTLMNLQKRGIKRLTIANRTLERAQKLAKKFDAEAIPFEMLKEGVKQADMVICSTASRDAIISTEFIKEIMGQRKNRPLFLIDIAVPRDIEKDVKELYNVFLYDIDDLKNIVSKNLKKREQEIPKVMAIIQEELNDFISWYKGLDVLPTIKQLQQHFEQIRQREVEKNRKYFAKEDWEQIDKFSRSLLKKFLHSPMVRLHECKDASELCGKCTIREVFGLDEYK